MRQQHVLHDHMVISHGKCYETCSHQLIRTEVFTFGMLITSVYMFLLCITDSSLEGLFQPTFVISVALYISHFLVIKNAKIHFPLCFMLSNHSIFHEVNKEQFSFSIDLYHSVVGVACTSGITTYTCMTSIVNIVIGVPTKHYKLSAIPSPRVK